MCGGGEWTLRERIQQARREAAEQRLEEDEDVQAFDLHGGST